MKINKRLVLGGGVFAVLIIGALGIIFYPTPEPTIEDEPLVPVQEVGQQYRAYLTGYTYFDNTPPGTSRIAFAKSYNYPTIHDEAGGVGTYDDPITLAVGHVIEDGTSTPDFEPGTIFYIPNVRRYFIVEDLCGDGNRPQDIPCHNLTGAPRESEVWLDLWIGGRDGDDRMLVDRCMNALTGAYLAIKDPLPTYVTDPGPLFEDGKCTRQYGNKALLQI